MKLICVSNNLHVNHILPVIEIGGRVTAIDETENDGLQFWRLKEYPGSSEMRFWYDKRQFATLPEKSADEMAIEQHEALIYQR